MYLSDTELRTYYAKADKMPPAEVTLYLSRANSYAYGILGGKPSFTHLPLDEAAALEMGLKTAVALAFEFFTRGETAQINPVNGNITEAAPAGYFQRAPGKQYQLEQVDKMLLPYAAMISQSTTQPNNGVSFL